MISTPLGDQSTFCRTLNIEEPGKITVHTWADVKDIVEMNKAQRNSFDERGAKYDGKNGFHLKARIPMHIYNKLVDLGIANDKTAMKRWLNDPDNRAWVVRPGQL